MEFYDVHLSYIDIEIMEEEFVAVPEQGSGTLSKPVQSVFKALCAE